MTREAEDKKTENPSGRTARSSYSKKPHTKITLNVDNEVLDYFKDLSAETGILYQKLINLYLVDCARTGQKLQLSWGQKDVHTT